MKKVFAIFKFEEKNIHVPSTDYYARGNQSETDSINIIHQVGDTFSTFEEAEKDILEGDYSNYGKDYTLTILPIYVKK